MDMLLRAYDRKQDYIAYQGTQDLESLSSFIHHFGDCEISQFVGISDKNGTKIFSNDIIRLTSYFGFYSDIIKISICEVYYNEKQCRFLLKDSLDSTLTIPLNSRNSENYEIIGNFYKNKSIDFIV